MPFAVKDIRLACDLFGKSGTKVGSAALPIYDVVKAGQSRQFDDLNMGFVDTQSATAHCEIIGAVVSY
jgi:hypothetical protein